MDEWRSTDRAFQDWVEAVQESAKQYEPREIDWDAALERLRVAADAEPPTPAPTDADMANAYGFAELGWFHESLTVGDLLRPSPHQRRQHQRLVQKLMVSACVRRLPLRPATRRLSGRRTRRRARARSPGREEDADPSSARACDAGHRVTRRLAGRTVRSGVDIQSCALCAQPDGLSDREQSVSVELVASFTARERRLLALLEHLECGKAGREQRS